MMVRTTLNTCLGLALLITPFACGEEDKEGGTATTQEPTVVEVCGDEVSCGDDCINDDSCPSGQHCAADNTCYAECTPSAGCDGTCLSNGRCDGMRQLVFTGPVGGGDDGPLLIGDDAPGSSGGGLVSEECATSRNAGELTPVSMFVFMDNSLSMRDQNKWDNASSAMSAFFQDPDTAGLSIALRFFGNNPQQGCDEGACDNGTIDACAAPQVGLGEVSAQAGDPQESALVQAVQGTQPDFAGTPMFAALSGASQWAVAHQAQNSGQQTVILFVTDGEPRPEDSCASDTASIAAIAGDAFAQGVLVYAIGLEGSNEQQMNQIAASGGTGQGVFIGAQNAEQDLLAALNQIRGEVASCDIQIPAPQNGTVDHEKVNVTLTLSGEEATLGQVDSAGECDDLAGWHYNDENDPTRILLCPAACDAVMVDPMSQIDIVLGCEVQQSFPTLTR